MISALFDFLLSEDFLAIAYSVMFVWLSFRAFRYMRGMVLLLFVAVLIILGRGLLVYLPQLFNWDEGANFFKGNLARLVTYIVVYGILTYATIRRFKANHGDATARAHIDEEALDFKWPWENNTKGESEN